MLEVEDTGDVACTADDVGAMYHSFAVVGLERMEGGGDKGKLQGAVRHGSGVYYGIIWSWLHAKRREKRTVSVPVR